MATDEQVIAHTRNWIERVVIGLGFCPFAAREMSRDAVRYAVVRDAALEACLEAVIDACTRLDADPASDTALLIFPEGFAGFEHYLVLLELAEDLLAAQGLEGVYQLASFHPEYRFADAPADDPANYTNRSPYPMLHLLRESAVARAVAGIDDAEVIPQRNIEVARGAGLARMQHALAGCFDDQRSAPA